MPELRTGIRLDRERGYKTMKYYEAILHTGSRSRENILQQAKEEKWIGPLSEYDISNMIESGKCFDGARVTVIEDTFGSGYSLIFWNPEDDEKIKNAFYYMEQDPFFGTYINDREGFEATWAAGEYEPGACIGFSKDEVEIIGPLQRREGSK